MSDTPGVAVVPSFKYGGASESFTEYKSGTFMFTPEDSHIGNHTITIILKTKTIPQNLEVYTFKVEVPPSFTVP